MEERDFASAILRVDGHRLPRYLDLDCGPPEPLLSALAKYSSLRHSELEHLIVKPTAAILSVTNRDAYCPQCFGEDSENGIYYRRRLWLDAWTFICERHGCMLGRLDSVKGHTSYGISASNVLSARRNPAVISVKTPPILEDDGTHANRFTSLLRLMLRTTAGRDLLLYIGSAAADVLYYELTGVARLWNRVWHDAERVPLWPPAIEHPLGSIETRLNAAYVATYLWENLYSDRGNRRGKLIDLFADEIRRSQPVFSSFYGRWSRADRDQFGTMVKLKCSMPMPMAGRGAQLRSSE